MAAALSVLWCDEDDGETLPPNRRLTQEHTSNDRAQAAAGPVFKRAETSSPSSTFFDTRTFKQNSETRTHTMAETGEAVAAPAAAPAAVPVDSDTTTNTKTADMAGGDALPKRQQRRQRNRNKAKENERPEQQEGGGAKAAEQPSKTLLGVVNEVGSWVG